MSCPATSPVPSFIAALAPCHTASGRSGFLGSILREVVERARPVLLFFRHASAKIIKVVRLECSRVLHPCAVEGGHGVLPVSVLSGI